MSLRRREIQTALPCRRLFAASFVFAPWTPLVQLGGGHGSAAVVHVVVALRRVNLVQVQLAVELAQEGLNQFEDTLVQLFTLLQKLLLFVDRD